MKNLTVILLSFGLFACKDGQYNTKVHFPSEQYHYVQLDTSRLPASNLVYVPIYSHIYMQNGTRATNLAATLSVRSMNFNDSIYISKVDYYSSQGTLLKAYLDSAVLLKPMNSVEFVVEEQEAEGGAGANFIVEWRAADTTLAPLVQAVMLGTYNNMGISFTTDGVKTGK